MGRGATAAFLTALANSKNRPVHLHEYYFDEGVVRNTDAFEDITWSGNAYIANGYHMSFSNFEESLQLFAARATYSLSGVDQAWISQVLFKRYLNRRVRTYLALLDDLYAVIVNPILIFEGLMDSPRIQSDPDSGASVVTLDATSIWANFEFTPGRHTNHEEQQTYFPGDNGFQYMPSLALQKIRWGR